MSAALQTSGLSPSTLPKASVPVPNR
jgi:hypothetical protein